MTNASKRKLFGRRDFLQVITNHSILDDYQITKELGKGSFASVKLATNRKTGVKEVVKRISVDPKDEDL